MSTSSKQHLPSVLPLGRLLLLLGGSVGLSWLMVPRQGELIDRLLKDHQYERVMAVLASGGHGVKSAGVSGLSHLSTGQLAIITELLKLTPREQLKVIFAVHRAPPYDAYVHNIALAAIQFVDVISPADAYAVIAPRLDHIPEAMRTELLTVIARNAQAVSQPELGAKALQQLCLGEGSNWLMVEDMVRCSRWAGQTKRAAEVLDQWLAGHQANLSTEELLTVHTVRYGLNVECGRPSEALNDCLTILNSNNDRADVRQWMERALSTALQSSRTEKLMPLAQKYLVTFPEAKLDLGTLRAEPPSDSQRLEDYKRWLTHVAQWSDWQSQFENAYDAHLRLAALGNLNSLDRCLDLDDVVGRREDTVALLEMLGDLPGRESLQLTRAHLLAEIGREAKAREAFERWLGKHPGDRDARYDYASLLEDMGEESASREAFEQMLKLHPADLPTMKRLADARIRHAEYKEALELLKSFPPEGHDHHTLESYVMLAESLDDHEAQINALRLTAQHEKKPKPEIYEDLAEAASYLQDQQPAIDALNEGLARMPHSAVLRVALANVYLEAERPDDAMTALLSEETKQNAEAIQVLLSIASEISAPKRVLDFMGDNVEKRFHLPPRQRLELAVLNQQAGRSAEAVRLVASVRESPSSYRMLAESRFQMGMYEEAARLQNAHLRSHVHTSPAEWVFLGDIYEQMGRLDEAKKAYDFSLSLLTADIPGTAAN